MPSSCKNRSTHTTIHAASTYVYHDDSATAPAPVLCLCCRTALELGPAAAGGTYDKRPFRSTTIAHGTLPRFRDARGACWIRWWWLKGS